MATVEERIKRGEQRLKDLAEVRDIIGEDYYWQQVDYELKYLKPLYEELKKEKS